MGLGRAGRTIAVLGMLVTFALALLVQVPVLYPEGHISLLYALPVLLAAWLFPPRAALAVALLAVGGHSVDSWLDNTAPFLWISEAAVIAVISTLAIWGAQQARAARGLVHELTEARRQREQFLAMVSHELGGSLTVIAGYAQLLAQGNGQGPQVPARAAERVLSQTKSMVRLVADLRDVSRIERGHFELRPHACDLVALARKVVEEQQSVAPNHRLLLNCQAEALTGTWDCDRLSQALTNLVRNAVNYSPGGGEVKVSLGAGGNTAWVSIADQGVGMSREEMAQLFRPYTRLERVPGARGMGLGLYITKAIVEAHRGTIDVRSEPGRGSVFTITLPLARGCDRLP